MATRNRYRLIVGLFLFFTVATIARSQEQLVATITSLPNGMRLELVERHDSPLVAIDLWVQAGAREERPGEEGSAHFLEHTLFKGGSSRRGGDPDIAIENLGGILNAATGPDYAHFFATVAAVHLPQALKVVADVAEHAPLPDADVNRERGVILDELAQHNADSDARLVDLLYAAAFGEHPYRHSPGGSSAQIAARGRDTLAAFHHRCYTPGRSILVLAGDISPAQGEAAARQAFGDWATSENGSASPNGQNLSIHSQAIARKWDNVDDFRSGDVREASPDRMMHIGLAIPAPAGHEAANVAVALVTAALLGDQPWGGRLAHAPGMFREASARFTPRRNRSLFLLTATLETGNGETAEQLMRGQHMLLDALVGLQTAPPSASEMQAARRRVLGRMMVDMETCGGLARAWGYAAMIEAENPVALRERVLGVTARDVVRFVADAVNSKQVVTGCLSANEEKPVNAR